MVRVIFHQDCKTSSDLVIRVRQNKCSYLYFDYLQWKNLDQINILLLILIFTINKNIKFHTFKETKAFYLLFVFYCVYKNVFKSLLYKSRFPLSRALAVDLRVSIVGWGQRFRLDHNRRSHFAWWGTKAIQLLCHRSPSFACSRTGVTIDEHVLCKYHAAFFVPLRNS